MRRLPVALGALLLTANLRASASSNPKPSGLVVESVDEESLPGKVGIKAGDVLVGWERAANPPHSPSSARGTFVTPMDLEEVCIEETQRGVVTLIVSRSGQSLSFALPVGFFDEFSLFYNARTLPVHPPLEGPDLDRYLEGVRRAGAKDLAGAADAWRPLAEEWSRSAEPSRAVWLWFRTGVTLAKDKKKLADAQTAYESALTEARRLGMPEAERQILYARARAYWRQYDLERSLQTFAECRRVSDRVRSPSLLVAEALSEEGGMLSKSGRPSEGLGSLQQAVAISGSVAPGMLTHGAVLVDLASCAESLGDFETAERHAREAVVLGETTHRKGLAFLASETLSGILFQRGDLAGAEALDQQLLATAVRDYPGTKGEAYAAGNLGSVAFRRGDLAAAEKYHLRDLAIEEKVLAGSEGHADCLSSLGDVAEARGDLAAAEGFYRRSLEIQEKLAGDTLNVTDSLDGLGRLALRRGDPAAAAGYFQRALDIQERTAPGGVRTAASLDGLGRAASARGDLDSARAFYEKALSLLERLSPGSLSTAETLHEIGLLERKQKHLEKAAAYLRRAIDALETQKRRLGGTEESRGLFAASHADYYRDYADVLIELGRREDAFRVMERSRASALLAMLAERDLTFAADVPPEVERERKLADAAYDKAQGEIRDLGSKDDSKREELLTQLRELRQKQEQIADRLKKASPRYGALKYPQPLDLAGARAALDPGTLLLSYSIGERESRVFAVLAGARSGPLLTVIPLPVGEKELRKSVQAFRTLIELGEPSKEVLARGLSLYDALLKPAEKLIARSDRLLILPDGPLHVLPWPALVRGIEDGRPAYFVEGKPVHVAISATVYAELKKQRRSASPAPVLEAAAFGDPLYPVVPMKAAAVRRGEDGADPNGAATEDSSDGFGPIEDLQVRSVLRGGYRFDALPASRREAEAVASLYAPKSVAYLGADASEEHAKALGKDVPLIHFACHAFVNERFPLDSALVLTIPEKPREGQDNGLLQAWEIFEKMRIDADLVTLSACESALGKEMGGEGLVGLTRAFQYAGARSVLSSLWMVEDEGTGELMRRFYAYRKAGKPKDEALRLAQVDLLHSAKFSAPLHWAGFQLNGDWK